MDYSMEELVMMVGKLVEKYTCKDSTSVPYEIANQLMEAVLYCIREGDSSIDHLSAGTDIIEQKAFRTAEEAYQMGFQVCTRKFSAANTLYMELMKDFRDYHNRAYRETVVDGMNAFFKQYDLRFNPQDHLLTLDYPILQDCSDLTGIDRILKYLQCIHLEQKFLQVFPESTIRILLSKHHSEYEDLFINIPGIVYRNVLVNGLLRKRSMTEELLPEDYERLTDLLLKTDGKDLTVLLERILRELIRSGFDSDEELYAYLKNDVDNFASELINGATYGNLNNIL